MTPNVVAVIPSNRLTSLLSFLHLWKLPNNKYPWDHTIVVADTTSKAEEEEFNKTIHNIDQTIDIVFPDAYDSKSAAAGLFSRGSSACRVMGYYYAHVNYAPTHYLTLDDDCLPIPDIHEHFVQAHLDALNEPYRWESPLAGPVRGIPFLEHNRQLNCDHKPPVIINVGLWTNNADLSSVHQLAHGSDWLSLKEPVTTTNLVHPLRIFPMSSMNLFFKDEALPLMYMPKMGEDSPYDRFEDIWCGLVAQRIMAVFSAYMTYGSPCVRHSRASDPIKNLSKEASGIAVNEQLWRDLCKLYNPELIPGEQVTEYVIRWAINASKYNPFTGEFEPYFNKWMTQLEQWCTLFV